MSQNTPYTSTAPTGRLGWLTHVAARDSAAARRGATTAVLLVIAAAATLVVLTVQAVTGIFTVPGALLRMLITLAVAGGLFMANRLGYTRATGTAMALLILLLNFAVLDMTGRELPGPAVQIVPILVAGLLGTPASALIMTLLAVAGHLIVNLQADPNYLTGAGSAISGLLNLYAQFTVVGIASWLFSRVSAQALEESSRYSLTLSSRQLELEQRFDAQNRYLQATTAIARAIVGVRDIDRLLEQAVGLVRETFNYYHVQVFLVDDDREYAVLRQSTGEAGQQLLASGHRLPVGSLSVIGQVTATGRPVVARDTDVDAIHRRNRLLPLTRSEMALPLVSGDQVIGALDLQSTEPDAFTPDVLPTLQAMADQLAIAIENARLYSQAQDNLRQLQKLYSEVTERSWTDFLASADDVDRRQVYGPEPAALRAQRSDVVRRVLNAGTVLVSSGQDGRPAYLAAPILVRGEVVGVIGVEPERSRDWTQDDVQLLQSVAERTALAVENARLYLQAQRAADRERLVNTIASRLQRAPNLAMLLESAAQELASALGTDNVYAEISLDQPLPRREAGEGSDREAVEGAARQHDGSLPPESARDEAEEARAKS